MPKKIARWTPGELRLVKEHYPSIGTSDLTKAFPGRSVRALTSIAQRMGIKKSEGRLHEMGRENQGKRCRPSSSEQPPPSAA